MMARQAFLNTTLIDGKNKLLHEEMTIGETS